MIYQLPAIGQRHLDNLEEPVEECDLRVGVHLQRRGDPRVELVAVPRKLWPGVRGELQREEGVRRVRQRYHSCKNNAAAPSTLARSNNLNVST